MNAVGVLAGPLRPSWISGTFIVTFEFAESMPTEMAMRSWT